MDGDNINVVVRGRPLSTKEQKVRVRVRSHSSNEQKVRVRVRSLSTKKQVRVRLIYSVSSNRK